jgi:hypothetical protein
MRLYSPQLAMPSLQRPSLPSVASADTQREGRRTKCPLEGRITSEVLNNLADHLNLLGVKIGNGCLLVRTTEQNLVPISLDKIPPTFEDLRILVRKRLKNR